MNFIIKRKWLIIFVWLGIVAGLFFSAPNMGELVREKGQISLPHEYSSTLAGEILKEVQEQNDGDYVTQIALVFRGDEKLTEEEIGEAERAIQLLEENKEELGITEILTHFNEETLEDKLVSKDGKAILSNISIQWQEREGQDIRMLLEEVLADIKVDHSFTSDWLVNEDLVNSSQEGLKKTEGITIVFILVVLLLVFKSFIAPLIPLITVGVSYLASQSIVAFLVDKVDFPISTYTQIFLVVVLFGIGTDYCILLLSRFKEELAERETVSEAILETYRNGGRTVLFSGIAVMIGFSAIGFSKFIVYQSAAAVAVGVAVLLIALFTVVPFFMAVLGRRLFWPSKMSLKHGDNKLWTLFGQFSLSRPVASLLVVAAVCVPFLLFYDGELSYDSMQEISADEGSVKAYHAIAEHFSAGEAMPTQIVLKNDEELDSMEYISIAENISAELEKIDFVSTIRSVTRPTGEPIEEFFVAKQAETLEEGIGEGKDGLSQISERLKEASTELATSKPELSTAAEGIQEMISGTDELQSGLAEVGTNLALIEDGIRQGAMSSNEIKSGLEKTKVALEQLLGQYRTELLASYELMSEKLGHLTDGYQLIGKGIEGLAGKTTELFTHLDTNYEALAGDKQYQLLKGTVGIILNGIPDQQPGLLASVFELNQGLVAMNGGLAKANAGFSEALNISETELGIGLEQLIEGIEAQQAGLEQLANGQDELVQGVPQLTDGVLELYKGQKQLLSGFSDIDGKLHQLTDGLNKSVDGLHQVSEGLESAQEYLSEVTQAPESGGFYLPRDVFMSEEFADILDVYLSPNRKVMTFDVIFDVSPYSNEAMVKIEEIEEAVKRATKDTKLENAILAIGGITSTNADLDKMSSSDYARTAFLMLIGIAIILVFLFRSIIMPIYIIGSLILTYFTSVAINEAIFVEWLGYSGISWAVPFFAFVILVALGVDYSIFLMDRFNEYKELMVAQGMFYAMKKMGTVIISAAIILGGTFAAMMPSGMLSLLQIAAITIVGLLLYAFVVLPLFIPVMVKSFGKANWWPFKRV